MVPTSTTLERYPADPDPQRDQKLVSRRGKQRLRRAIGEAAAALAIVIPATAVGAAAGLDVATRPSGISIAPGISAEAQPTLSEALTITYGATVVIPGVHKDIGGLTASAKIDITELDSQSHTSGEQATSDVMLAAMDSAGPAVIEAFQHRARQGLTVGAGVFVLLALGGLLVWKRLKTPLRREDNELDMPPKNEAPNADPPGPAKNDNVDIGEHKTRAFVSSKTWRNIGVVAAVSAVTLGGGYWATNEYFALKAPLTESTSRIFPNDPANPIVELVHQYAPVLEDASVSGDIGYYAKGALTNVFERMKAVDSRWQERASYLANTALPRFRSRGGMDWQNNPNIVAFAHVSDIHDNRPFLKHFLPEVLDAMGVDFVVNTGDEMNYSGTLLLDDGAYERFAAALPASEGAIVVGGNHDEKTMHAARQLVAQTHTGQTYHPLVPLGEDNSYSTAMGGLVFVGSPDLNRTTAAGTDPPTRKARLDNNVKQGSIIADRACAIADETGVKPIVLAHEKEATYEAIVRGCASLALAGHNHTTYPVRAFANPDGSTTYEQVLGTASGDGPNNLTAIYNGPTTEGSISVWLYNLATQQFEKSISLSYTAHGPPSITANDLPEADDANTATDDPRIMKVLEPQD